LSGETIELFICFCVINAISFFVFAIFRLFLQLFYTTVLVPRMGKSGNLSRYLIKDFIAE